ncbi:hypothetical protein [Parasphingorhabdus sp.]|uniref:hypothetical protein n=1 Tax=Parasphingorhabdus sp. TaxID=2709688 RepID=UPI003A91F17C
MTDVINCRNRCSLEITNAPFNPEQGNYPWTIKRNIRSYSYILKLPAFLIRIWDRDLQEAGACALKFTHCYARASVARWLIFGSAIFVAAGMSISVGRAQNASPIPLSQFAGKWSGTGWGKRDGSAVLEPVRCRLIARYRKATRKLVFSGKCAATSRTFTLLGHLAHYPGTAKITGRWVNPGGVGSINIVGKRRLNQMNFEFQAKDRKSGKRERFRSRWKFRRSGFSINTAQLTPAPLPIGSITFERKN